jgi:hypothetical protein
MQMFYPCLTDGCEWLLTQSTCASVRQTKGMVSFKPVRSLRVADFNLAGCGARPKKKPALVEFAS